MSRSLTRGWFRPVLGLGLIGTAAVGIGWLVSQSMAPAQAQTPTPTPAAPASPAPAPAQPATDANSRVVAYIYGNQPITREELGEYLIARYGAEKLTLLINKKIIEHACHEKNIDVSAAEVEADIDATINGIGGVDRKTFIEKVLAARHLSLYEWREDVVRPRLLLAKLCRDRVKVEEKEIQQEFEAHYGEKVEARVIIYPKETDSRVLMRVYDEIKKDPDAFDREAAQQPDGNLARVGGRIKPICRYNGLEAVWKPAFRLQPGQISEQIVTPEGIVIIKCTGRVAADTTKTIDKEREALTKEVMEKKVAFEIGKVFGELQKEADPKNLIRPSMDEATLKRMAEDEMKQKQQQGAAPQKGQTPAGN